MIYLYVKTHKKTGLKYLGKTIQDPFKYDGSGIYWKKHLSKHGNDVHTEIIMECNNNLEVKQWGTYYSELWNIVYAKDENGKKLWANEKPESGDGAPIGKYHHQSHNNPNYSSVNHPNYGKKHSEGTLQKNRESNSGINNPQYGSKWITNGIINKKIKSGPIPDGWILGRIIDFGKYDKSGTNNPRYDSKIREFKHTSGITEVCTQRQLIDKYQLRESSVSSIISGRLKSTGGWRIASDQ